MLSLERLARERIRDDLELAQRRREVRRQRTLRRARRVESRAERRLIRAWRRAAELRARAGYPSC